MSFEESKIRQIRRANTGKNSREITWNRNRATPGSAGVSPAVRRASSPSVTKQPCYPRRRFGLATMPGPPRSFDLATMPAKAHATSAPPIEPEGRNSLAPGVSPGKAGGTIQPRRGDTPGDEGASPRAPLIRGASSAFNPSAAPSTPGTRRSAPPSPRPTRTPIVPARSNRASRSQSDPPSRPWR